MGTTTAGEDCEIGAVTYEENEETYGELLEVYKAGDAVFLDHPMIFYSFYALFGGGVSEGTTYTTYLLADPEFKDAGKMKLYREKLEASIKEIAGDAENYSSDADKAATIFDNICDKVKYARKEDGTPASGIYGNTIAGLVYNGSVVCEGYSKLFEAAANYVGLSSTVISGFAASRFTDTADPHAWNGLWLDGGFYAVDVTAGDPDADGLIGGNYDYFARGKWISRDHLLTNPKPEVGVDPPFNGALPELSDEDHPWLESASDLRTEERNGIYFNYPHKLPFWGKANLDNAFRTFQVSGYNSRPTISYNGATYTINKAKYNRKTGLFQVTDVNSDEGNAPKEARAAIKKATGGSNGLPITAVPYYVRQYHKKQAEIQVNTKFKQKAPFVIKVKKGGKAASVKILILDKYYKVSKSEMDIDPNNKIIKFNNVHLSGSCKISS